MNKLSINYSKSNYIIFSSSNITHNFNIYIDKNKLNRVSGTNYLGVFLDEKLNWKGHINIIKTKVSRGIHLISKLRNYININTLKMVYFSTVYPHLSYCITAWGGTYPSTILPIYKLQKRCIRIMSNSTFNSHTKPLFIKLNLLPLNYIYKLNLGKLFHKINNHKIIGTYNLIPINKIHNYDTRLSKGDNYYQNFNRLNIGQTTCSARGLQFWREIPKEIKSLPEHLFKNKLKKVLSDLLEIEE